MMRKLLVILVLLFSAAGSKAWAHVQGGPPYLLVAGEYADTTPLISSSPTVTVPQDITKTTHLPGQPVNFKVDLSRLSVPPTVAQSSKWRWRWDLGETNFEEGVELSHTFAQTGSYLVSLQVKDPTTTSFLDYDLVQVNIVPSSEYRLPTGQIKAKISRDNGTQDVSFSGAAVTDPSTSIKTYTWDFGDGTTGQGNTVLHSYSHNTASVYPLLRVTDQNGLFTDTAIEITSDDKINQLGSTYISSASAKPQAGGPNWLIWTGLGLSVLSLVLVVVKKFRS